MTDTWALRAQRDAILAQIDARLIDRPTEILPIAFGGNPNGGLRSDTFVGSAVASLRTVNVRPQRTAELRERSLEITAFEELDFEQSVTFYRRALNQPASRSLLRLALVRCGSNGTITFAR